MTTMTNTVETAGATVDSELPFTRGDQSITLPGAANRQCGEESTQ